jgi:hypothetical protein
VTGAAIPERRKFDRRKVAPFVLVAALVGVWLVLGPRLPHDQTVHVVLGKAAPRVTELRLAYAEGDEQAAAREVTFHFAEGEAPRVVTHEPRLANGEYRVEIDVYAQKGHAQATRRVKLSGDPVSVDVQEIFETRP